MVALNFISFILALLLGKKAFGVGFGSVPTFVERTAHVQKADGVGQKRISRKIRSSHPPSEI